MTPIQLRTARRSLGLSQSGLAERLGVDVMTISRWERGASSIPPYLGLAIESLSRQRKTG
jgi:transcriptional regulator with XRE-family HTH domain